MVLIKVLIFVSSKKSGHFMKTRTKNRYIFYLTGKGEQVVLR